MVAPSRQYPRDDKQTLTVTAQTQHHRIALSICSPWINNGTNHIRRAWASAPTDPLASLPPTYTTDISNNPDPVTTISSLTRAAPTIRPAVDATIRVSMSSQSAPLHDTSIGVNADQTAPKTMVQAPPASGSPIPGSGSPKVIGPAQLQPGDSTEAGLHDSSSGDHSVHNNAAIDPDDSRNVSSAGHERPTILGPDTARQTSPTELQPTLLTAAAISVKQSNDSHGRGPKVVPASTSNIRVSGQVFDSVAPFPASTVLVGPLTTDFTPPESCTTLGHFTAFNATGNKDASLDIVWAFERGQLCADVAIADGCLPSKYMEKFSQNLGTANYLETIPVFSPGDRCPIGYEGACTMVPQTEMADPQGKTLAWAALQEGDMAIGCCPSGYGCYGGGRSCISTAYPSATFTDSSCIVNTSPSTITIQSSTLGYAFDVQMIYVKRGTLPGAPAMHSNGGLSTGAKAAIGIMVPLVVIASALGAFFFYKRRRKTPAIDVEQVGTKGDERLAPSEVPDYSIDMAESEKKSGNKNENETPVHEISADAMLEMEGDSSFAPLEMDAVEQSPHDTLQH